jgi:hypothetical protein
MFVARKAKGLVKFGFSSVLTELTPHQLWLTQGRHMERPFTGEYWHTKDVGTYHCLSCDHALFRYPYSDYPYAGRTRSSSRPQAWLPSGAIKKTR